jgi:hypothetical protein
MIMDMSARMRWKALNRGFDVCRTGAPEFCRLRPCEWRHPLKGRRSDSLPAKLSHVLVLAAFSLWLTGCATPQPNTTSHPTPPPPAETNNAPALVVAPKPPEAPSKPAPRAPQQPQRISESKRPPATASRGAEKLVASSAPLTVRAREKTPVKAESVEPKALVIADSSTVTDTPVQELVFKGPPHQVRPRLSPKKLLLWFGLGLGVAALGVVARLALIQRAKPIKSPEAKEDDLRLAPGLLLKESVNAPPAAMAAEKNY